MNKLEEKRNTFLARTAELLQCTPEAAMALLDTPLQSAIRPNSLQKFTYADLLMLAKSEGWEIEPLAWTEAVLLKSNKSLITHHSAFTEGKLYLQNPSSFLPVLALEPQPGERILDMAAAPGGKASHIASLTNNQAELIVNDNSRPRLAKMQQNFARLNVQPATYLLSTFERLPQHLEPESLDKILLDAPCSGEGLIHPEDHKAFTYWSTAQIKRLGMQQKRAIRTAWRLLKPGGTLVYSTCTMAPEENEAVVDYLLRREPGAVLLPIAHDLPHTLAPLTSWRDKTFASDLSQTLRIKPGSGMEAFFVAKLYKQPYID